MHIVVAIWGGAKAIVGKQNVVRWGSPVITRGVNSGGGYKPQPREALVLISARQPCGCLYGRGSLLAPVCLYNQSPPAPEGRQWQHWFHHTRDKRGREMGIQTGRREGGRGRGGGGCVFITMQIDLSGFNVDKRVRCWDCVSRGCWNLSKKPGPQTRGPCTRRNIHISHLPTDSNSNKVRSRAPVAVTILGHYFGSSRVEAKTAGVFSTADSASPRRGTWVQKSKKNSNSGLRK